jgi:hypothetical protein
MCIDNWKKISLFVLDGRSQSPRVETRSLISETGSAHLAAVASAAYPPVIVSRHLLLPQFWRILLWSG